MLMVCEVIDLPFETWQSKKLSSFTCGAKEDLNLLILQLKMKRESDLYNTFSFFFFSFYFFYSSMLKFVEILQHYIDCKNITWVKGAC